MSKVILKSVLTKRTIIKLGLKTFKQIEQNNID
jgi:hypothetical protein